MKKNNLALCFMLAAILCKLCQKTPFSALCLPSKQSFTLVSSYCWGFASLVSKALLSEALFLGQAPSTAPKPQPAAPKHSSSTGDTIQSVSMANQVLTAFKNDEPKRKAAVFLLKHMRHHYSENIIWTDSLDRQLDYEELDYPDFKTSVDAFKEKTKNRKVKPQIVKTWDMDTITADYVIKHINMVFKYHNKPWNQHLSFEEFCEYVLPYRVMNESLQRYHDVYAQTFGHFIDSLTQNGKNYELQCLINMEINKGYISTFRHFNPKYKLPLQGPLNLVYRKQGDCTDMANYAAYAMRSVGLPVAVDFTPWYATSTGRHFWNVTWNHNKEASIFMGTSQNPGEYFIPRELGKVFRFKYSVNKNWITQFVPKDQLPPGFFRNQHLFDVTPEYGPCTHLTFSLQKQPQPPYAYISVFNGLSWKPVFWGKTDTTSKVRFNNMERGAVYLPQIYANKKFIPAAYPKLVRKNGTVQELKPNLQQLRSVVIHEKDKYLIFRPGKKYKLFYWDNRWNPIEIKMAQNHHGLSFERVPLNALLLLVPEYTKGKDRIFTINAKGEREWW